MPIGTIVLGIDPGRRVGVAWVGVGGRLLRGDVVDVDALTALEVRPDVTVALGDGTGAAAAHAALSAAGIAPVLVDERASSEEGRRLYWRDHPARGWARLLPTGLRVPPRPIDDYAAYAIALRWLGAHGVVPAPHGSAAPPP